MRVFVFRQWEALMNLLKGIARGEVEASLPYALRTVTPDDGTGVVTLEDRTAGSLAVTGGVTKVLLPDPVSGRARDFLLRVSATGENELRFEGGTFEGEAGALDAPTDGSSALLVFTETAPGTFLVTRRVLQRLATD